MRYKKHDIANVIVSRGDVEHQTPNRAGKDKPFEDKKKGYEEMQLTLTSRLASIDKWTLRGIKERQGELAEFAVSAWPKN